MQLNSVSPQILQSLVPALPSSLALAQSTDCAVADKPSHSNLDIPRLDKLPRGQKFIDLMRRAVDDQLQAGEVLSLITMLIDETAKLSKLAEGREFQDRTWFPVKLAGRELHLIRDEAITYDYTGGPSRFLVMEDRKHAPNMSLAIYYNRTNGTTSIKLKQGRSRWIELETLANGKQRLAFWDNRDNSNLQSRLKASSQRGRQGKNDEEFYVNPYTKAHYILVA